MLEYICYLPWNLFDERLKILLEIKKICVKLEYIYKFFLNLHKSCSNKKV